VATMWDWLSQSGLQSLFGACDPTTGTCHLASRHALVGDVYLHQTRLDGDEVPGVWLLDSERGRNYNSTNPGDYLGAAQAEVEYLRDSGWVNLGTGDIVLTFATFCGRTHMFTLTDIISGVSREGVVVPKAISSGIIVDPYSRLIPILLDVVYLFLLSIPLVMELRDLVDSLREYGGTQGLIKYADPWNLMDWFGIVLAAGSIMNWLFCVEAMGVNSLVNIVDPATTTLVPNVMAFDSQAVSEIHGSLDAVRSWLRRLNWTMGINCITVIMRFFKAFEANPRLKILSKTLQRSASDIAHFSIILVFVFVVYSVTGHILFGGSLIEFITIPRSIVTSFTCLMGDFGWYVDRMQTLREMGQRMPRAMMIVWFWTFNLFVFMVLLNMLMAIILDHYAAVADGIKGRKDALTVWHQARLWCKRRRETKGFIRFSQLLSILEGQEEAEQGNWVTITSLQRMCPEMQDKQAQWLLDWAKGEIEAGIRIEKGSKTSVLIKDVDNLFQHLVSEHRNQSISMLQMEHGLHGLAEERRPPRKVTAEEWESMASQEPDPDSVEADEALLERLRVQSTAIQEMHQVVGNLHRRLLESPGGPEAEQATDRTIRTLTQDVSQLRKQLEKA